MICVVTPVQSDQVPGQFWNQFRIMQDNVAPEHQLPATRRYFAMNPFDKIQVNAPFPFFLAQFFGLPPAQVPGFVATNIESFASEMRKQFIIKLPKKWKCPRIFGLKCW